MMPILIYRADSLDDRIDFNVTPLVIEILPKIYITILIFSFVEYLFLLRLFAKLTAALSSILLFPT